VVWAIKPAHATGKSSDGPVIRCLKLFVLSTCDGVFLASVWGVRYIFITDCARAGHEVYSDWEHEEVRVRGNGKVFSEGASPYVTVNTPENRQYNYLLPDQFKSYDPDHAVPPQSDVGHTSLIHHIWDCFGLKKAFPWQSRSTFLSCLIAATRRLRSSKTDELHPAFMQVDPGF